MNNNTYESLYKDYQRLLKAKEEAEAVVLRNIIRSRVSIRNETQETRLKELEEMNKRLDLIQY